jgi:hypothetical protein
MVRLVSFQVRGLHREYNRRLLIMLRMLTVLMITCILVCAWGFGFLAK